MAPNKCISILLILLCQYAFAQDRTIMDINKNWRFTAGNPPNANAIDFDDSNWQKINIPHDWAIGEPTIIDGDGYTGKLPWKGEGWYRRELLLPENYNTASPCILLFDGVMAFPEVYINESLAGKWDYGYNSFYIDISAFLKPGEKNILAVYANTNAHDSRWYPGGGIYRKVQMLILNPVHISVWGTYITTPIVKSNSAIVRVQTQLENTTEENAHIQIVQKIFDAQHQSVATDTIYGDIASGRQQYFETDLTVLNPHLWDTEDPYLYTLESIVSADGKMLDKTTTSFGVRTIRFTADDGFYLNDKRLQIQGVNLHHDQGPLGAAFYPRAAERQLEIMKAMGVNAIRTSHNVAAPELLDLCDKMGILVFDEIFDKYDRKADILPETDFEEFAQRNIRNFILRDRNHPSVFIWSAGNEIGDVQMNENNGFFRLHTVLNYINKYDPSRPTTLVCDNMYSAGKRHFDFYDVHSWNYGQRYRLARQLEPNKSVIISESASTLSTRGYYTFPLPENKTDFTKDLQVSSYDLNAPWWAEISDDDLMWQQDENYIAGEFVWTGFDYLGEPTPYGNNEVKEWGMTDAQASRSSYFGIADLVGIPKDRYYLYKSYWKPDETTVHILPHWNWDGREGKITPVFVYTNGDCAELFLNGKSQGMQCKDPLSENSTERFRLMWKDVVYAPGELKAVAYKNGNVIGTAYMQTTGKPYALKLSADKTTIAADGMDLSYILIEAVDAKGNPHPLADNVVTIQLQGVGKVLGVGNGNPQSFDPFQAMEVRLFYGKAMIIFGSAEQSGKTQISVSADGLKNESIGITVN